MNNKAYISLDQVKAILQSLETERNKIYNTYKSNIAPVLNSSESCFKVAGLNTKDIISSFDNTFKQVDSSIQSLTNALNTTVIQGYSDTTQIIKNMFDKDFANKISSLLGIK